MLVWHEEPIAISHERASFDCGNIALNEFLRRHARKSHVQGSAKTFLALDNADGKPFSVTTASAPHQSPMRVRRRPSPAGWHAMTCPSFGWRGSLCIAQRRGRDSGANSCWPLDGVVCWSPRK